jgi:cell division protein ZapA (FtsZ GTPase activity inhibitor)
MANVGSLFVVLGLKASDYQEGLRKATKEANTAMKNIKKEFASLDMKAAVMGAAALTTAFVYAGKKFADAANEAATNKRRFDTMFGDMANSAGLWVDDFSKKIGRSNDDVRGWMAGFHQMLENMGIGEQKAAAMSKRMVELGIDIGSMFGAEDADVMMTIQKALAGQARGLMQYGIILKGVTQTDEEGNQVLNEKVSKMNNVQKAFTMYNAMLAQTANIQGDATRNMNTYGNQLKRLQGNVQDLRQEIGSRLTPVITDVYQKMNAWLQDSSNIDKMKEWGDAAAGLTKKMAELATGIAGHKDTVVLVIEAMFGAWAVNKLVKFAVSIGTIITSLKTLAAIPAIPALSIGAAGAAATGWAAQKTGEAAYQGKMMPVGPYGVAPVMPTQKPQAWQKPTAAEQAANAKMLDQMAFRAPLATMPSPLDWKPKTENIFADFAKPQIDASVKVKEAVKANDKETFDFWKKMAEERAEYGEWLAERKMNEAAAELAADQDHAKQLIEAEHERAKRINDIRTNLWQQEQAQIEAQKAAWISFGDTIANTMMYAMMQSGNAFQNIAKAFRDMLVNMAAQYAAKAAIFTLLRAIAPVSWGLPSLGKMVFGDMFRAEGGPVSANRPYIVGERGPEIIMPKTAGTVIPNGAGMVTNDNSRWELHFHDSDSRQKMVGLPDEKFAEQLKRCVRDGRISIRKLA